MYVRKLISLSIANNLVVFFSKLAVVQLTQESSHLSVWG